MMRSKHTIGYLKSSSHYTPNVVIWEGIAQRVLAGEFRSATEAEKEAVWLGLWAFKTPITERALTFLDHNL